MGLSTVCGGFAGGTHSPSYSPLDEGNCYFWLNSRDPGAVNHAAGALVDFTNIATSTIWDTSAAFPGYSAAGFPDGGPCLTFDGTTQYVLSDEAAVVGAIDGDRPAFTCVARVLMTDVDAATALFGFGGSGSTSNRGQIGFFSSGNGVFYYQRQGLSPAPNQVWSLGAADSVEGAAHTIEYQTAGGAADVFARIDGGSESSASQTDTANDMALSHVCVGARTQSAGGSFSLFFPGSIAQMIIFSTALDSAALARVRAYLTGD